MIQRYLHNAGFFPIQWLPAGTQVLPGSTYVRPSARGLLRVFLSDDYQWMELYTGSIFAGQLRYRGAVHGVQELQRLVESAQ